MVKVLVLIQKLVIFVRKPLILKKKSIVGKTMGFDLADFTINDIKETIPPLILLIIFVVTVSEILLKN